ncbi:MAG: hypothetical protein AB7T63_05610 [Planctomycetota bacterium]
MAASVRWAAGVLALGVAVFASALRPVCAEGDPFERAGEVLELARAWMDAGMATDDVGRVRAARGKLGEARDQVRHVLATEQGLSVAARARGDRMLEEVADRLEWCSAWLDRAGDRDEPGADAPEGAGVEGDAPKEPQAHPALPPYEEGAPLRPWCLDVVRRYRATEDREAKAALVAGLAHRGVVALPHLLDLFDEETDPGARPPLHQALADVGTPRLASWITARSAKRHEETWPDVIDVLLRALERPEKQEPEAPYLPAVRAFHLRKDRKLTLDLLEKLDALGREGVAALGEVLYVQDIGYHMWAIERLATKKDRRAVPPLVFKMNRFRFDPGDQVPAHKALLQLGWYAVPELIDRLDDKAAGIWISWTLRKISGETMGTDKRKWHDWWKAEQVRHPELFDDPDERPPGPVTNR